MGLRLLALACLVGAAFAGPFQRETGSQCSTQCPKPSHPKFDYETGKKYVFEYRGENYITVAGQRKQKATIEGLAEFHFITKCEGILKLKNMRIEQKLSQEEIDQLVQKLEVPLSFSYDDGKIERLCPSAEESQQSLNIKKGVLSSMINTMSKLDSQQTVKENDSLGTCVTQYTVKYANGLEIKKEKNLKSCTNRHSSLTSLITNPYDSPDSNIHTLPIFPEESLECKQHIENKIIKSVKCREQAKIKPLKHRDSVIQFEGLMELNLINKQPADNLRLDRPSGPQPILYNLEEEQNADSQEREVEQILREMCSKNTGVIDISVSKDFIKLVRLVKTLPYQSIQKIHRSLQNGNLCRSKKVLDIFVDTLPMAGSDAAVKLMVHLLEQREITGLKAKLWPASLALIPKPTKETVEAVVPLMKMEHSASVLLGVSAMLHRFCRLQKCDNIQEVQEIVSVLNEQLGRGCSSSQEDKVFSVLKAFGNIGYHGEAKNNIVACAQDSSKPARLRLAAVDAFRRTDKKRPQEILQLYTNTDEDFEIRIAALSSVMKKADERQLREIKQTAEQESNEQVSGYASTLINNLKKTSSPLKKSVRNLLQQIDVNTPKVNYWENSKNIELSSFSESLNLGGGIEADIVHSSDSKIPRSIYTRFDMDVFDKNINVVEVGVRAEGLEALVKKLIGLKDKIPKASWEVFNSKSIFGETDAEASLFIRTMNTELFDISASDLTALGELVQIAELMNKMANEKKSDFSHSFLFLNSKLVIPSVTGRSYSIDVTGSATVGLTASSKANLLSFPRSADVHAHFQPSVNVEISTTVGIQSNKQRPDIKLVSSMHLESDMEAKFQIKDGHVALVSVSMPSENVVLAKISSDVVEIDAHHQEKRMFDKMQKKIDYCFNKLEKALGVSVCGKWEVPKPFVTKTFPFVQGVGNVEFAIKKTDSSFKSYELSVEIPRDSGSAMRYKASLDTPGSRVSRRFAAEVDIKNRGKGQNEFSVELTSPFKSAGGSGAYTKRDDLVQGSFELHSSSSRMFTANVSTQIISSRSRMVLKPSIEMSFLNRQPLRAEGSISVIKGKKQQITIDITANKPSSKPLAIKGTILKEGQFELSKRAEWKLSSDLSIQSPIIDAQIRSAVEKRSQQAEKISTSFSVDYQIRRMQQHSIKFSGTSQKSASKISTNAQFENTQLPSANWAVNWDMQGEARQNLKNDITLKYGRNPERTYININQRSRIPRSGPGACSVSVKAPQYNIESELTVSHDIDFNDTPKVHLEADLCYKKDMHLKGLVNLNYESRQPLKASTKVELEYPNGKISYSDEVEEVNQNSYEGKARLQWKESKQVELKYKYHNLSDRSKHQYEIETALQVPSSRSPIKSRASLRLSGKSLGMEGHLSLDRNSEYALEAHLNQQGVSHLSVKSPMLEGNVKVKNEDRRKALDADLKLKTRNSRHITASAKVDLEDKTKFEAEVLLDADRRPDRKMSASTKVEISRRGKSGNYAASAQLQVLDLVSISFSESGENSLLGNHEGRLEASLKNYESFSISHRSQLSQDQAKSVIKVSKNGVAKAEMELQGGLQNNRNQQEVSAKVSMKSLDNSFESKEFSMNHQLSSSGSAKMMKSRMKFQKSPSQIYKAEWNSDLQQNGMEMKAQVHTPHAKFSKQALGISLQNSEDSISSSVSIEIPDNQVISMTSEIKKKSDGVSATLAVKSPFDIVRDIRVHLAADNQRSRKSIQSYIDVNSARISEIEGRMTSTSNGVDAEGKLKLNPIPNVSFQGLSFSYQQSRSSLSVSGKVQLANSKEISVSSEVKKERESISATAALSTPYRKAKDAKVHFSIDNQSPKRNLLFYIDVNEERKGDIEISISTSSNELEVQSRLKTSRTPEISAHLKAEKSGESFSVSGKILKGTSPLFSTSLSKETYRGGKRLTVKTESFEKTLLDLQITKEDSSNNMKFNLKASGSFAPVSLSISSSQNDKSSVNMEISACQESQTRTCYSVKGYHKVLINSESYNHYRKMTFDLEKSSGGSGAELLTSATLLLTAGDHDYRSKIMMQLKNKNVGYEVRVHRRQNENDHCSIESQIFMPESTSRVRASLLHNTDRTMLEIEAYPNMENQARKYGLEMKTENHRQTNEVSGYIQIVSPSMNKPIQITGRLQKQGNYPIRGKLEIQYPSSSRDKVLILEVEPQIEQGHSGKKAIVYRIYRKDQSLDASFTLMKQNAREQDMYGYEWAYKSSRQGEKKGGFSIKLSQKTNGRPQNIDITYFTPSADLKVQGRSRLSSSGSPSDVSLSVLSAGQKIKEIRIRTSDSCVDLEVTRSGPFFKSSLCMNKHEGNTVQFVSIDAHYRQHKCLDIQVRMNPENPDFIDIICEWKKEDLSRALSELTGLGELLQNRSMKQMKQELKKQINHLLKDVRPTLKDWMRKLNEIKEEVAKKWEQALKGHSQMLREQVRKMQSWRSSIITNLKNLIPWEDIEEQLLKPIHKAFTCFVDEYLQLVVKHLPDISHVIWEVTKDQWEQCMKKFCTSGTFCHDLVKTYQRHGFKKTQMLIQKKISQTKRSIEQQIDRANIPNPLTYVREVAVYIREEMNAIFGNIFGDRVIQRIADYGKDVEKRIKQKVDQYMDFVMKYINDAIRRAEKDEDFKTALALVSDAQKKLVRAWSKKEQLAKDAWEPVQKHIMENARKAVEDKVRVTKYNPKVGEIRIQLRNPMGPAHIQVLQNELQTIKRKIQKSISPQYATMNQV